ncbi:DUF3551 domain-containing protein [Bradyrhizobium erythrophlei]|uniref:DUF3551 domain-containing protein n=1 Tax=Bradyrhizobium erythrophlei TaxID=1437360 RepID=UPI0035E80469
MKRLTSAILILCTLVGFAPASAQTYDPSYPVCMHVYGEKIGERIDCTFTSFAQCAATANGLPATCLVNPYVANARRSPLPRSHRPRDW